jgi:hypothetical protein
MTATGTEIGLAENLDVSFVEAAEPRWQSYAGKQWFADIEQECDEVVREFFQGAVG